MIGKYLIYKYGKSKASKKYEAELEDLLYDIEELQNHLKQIESRDDDDQTRKSDGDLR